jgi:hypothetical protein
MMNDEEKTGRAEAKRRREEEKKNRGQESGIGGHLIIGQWSVVKKSV